MLGGRTNHWGRISLRMGPGRFQAAQPRRHRRRLADHLRRDQAVLRQARSAGRDLRIDGRDCERAGRDLPAAAEAALLRAADQAGRRHAEHHLHSESPVDPDAAAERPAGVPLLRPVRTRLLDARELLVHVGAAAAGAGDRQAAHHHQRDGARSAHRRRAVWRPASRTSNRADRRDYARARADRRARGERVRIGAAAAQLDVGPISRRPRQFQRRRRTLSHRFDRASASAGTSRRWSTACRTTRTAPAARISTCRGGSTTRTSTSRAATTSSWAAEAIGAELRVHGRHPALQRRRRLRQVAEGRLPPLLRRDRRTSPAAAR